MAGEAIWPLTREHHELVAMLASMIRRFGTERFLAAPLVRADKRDFPDPWEATLHAVHQLLYRQCWHAFIDPEIAVVDRRPFRDLAGLLTTSDIELASCRGGIATFALGTVAIAYWRWCKPYNVCADHNCGKRVSATDKSCPACASTITKTVTKKQLDAHYRALRAAEDALDLQIDPSEFAGDPDAEAVRKSG